MRNFCCLDVMDCWMFMDQSRHLPDSGCPGGGAWASQQRTNSGLGSKNSQDVPFQSWSRIERLFQGGYLEIRAERALRSH